MTKVLVVEDTPLNMELVTDILESQGFTVDKAENGEEAIKKAKSDAYDLILMDISLPGIDGIEATKAIKSEPEYRDVPVIALTAFAMRGDRERLLGAGFKDYVPKPIDVPEFIERMGKYRK